ncbi:MAG: hypothetical protein DRN06_07880, partial [Thermoprotei archaeon]
MTPHATSIKVPITRLNTIIESIGIDAHQFHDMFKLVSIRTIYPVLYGGREAVRRKMHTKPNAYIVPKNNEVLRKARQTFDSYAGRILVPDRIWWDTAHVLALYSDVPVLSNIFYAVRLNVPEKKAKN